MKYHRVYHLQVPAFEAFDWLTNGQYLPRLFPYWSGFKAQNLPILKKNEKLDFMLKTGLISTNWIVNIDDFTMGKELFIKAEKSPFKLWEQYWRVKPARNNCSTFAVDIQLEPEKDFFHITTKAMIKELERNGIFRELRLNKDYQMLQKYPFKKPLKIAITGSHGLIGSELTTFLKGLGHKVYPIIHSATKKNGDIYWHVDTQRMEAQKLEGMDVIIHLAGKNIAEKRWSKKQKQALLENRSQGAALMADAILSLKQKPKLFICASAIGYYTGLKYKNIDESYQKGRGFAAELTQAIEQQASRVANAGIRTIIPRFAPVLTPKGGALKKLITPTLLGFAGPLGSGKQPFSWISIDDTVYGLYHCMMTPSVEGIVNFVAPHKTCQAKFMQDLARILHRPCFLPMPEAAVKLIFGQMGEELLLEGMDIEPAKLLDSGYDFMHITATDALHWLLGK